MRPQNHRGRYQLPALRRFDGSRPAGAEEPGRLCAAGFFLRLGRNPQLLCEADRGRARPARRHAPELRPHALGGGALGADRDVHRIAGRPERSDARPRRSDRGDSACRRRIAVFRGGRGRGRLSVLSPLPAGGCADRLPGAPEPDRGRPPAVCGRKRRRISGCGRNSGIRGAAAGGSGGMGVSVRLGASRLQAAFPAQLQLCLSRRSEPGTGRVSGRFRTARQPRTEPREYPVCRRPGRNARLPRFRPLRRRSNRGARRSRTRSGTQSLSAPEAV